MRRVVNRAMGKKPHLKSLFIPLNSSLLLNAFVQTETHSGLDLALKASNMTQSGLELTAKSRMYCLPALLSFKFIDTK